MRVWVILITLVRVSDSVSLVTAEVREVSIVLHHWMEANFICIHHAATAPPTSHPLADNTPIRFPQLVSHPYSLFIGSVDWVANTSQHSSGHSWKRHFSLSWNVTTKIAIMWSAYPNSICLDLNRATARCLREAGHLPALVLTLASAPGGEKLTKNWPRY